MGRLIFSNAQQGPERFGDGYNYFAFVLLAQGKAGTEQPSLRLLGLMNTGMPVYNDRENYPLSVDVSSIPIRKDEYAFGIRHIVGSLGKKSGSLHEIMSFYRFHDLELKEIFRDVVWVYDKYSVKDYGSCNVDMKIVPQPSQEEGFFDQARKFSRSYIRDAPNPPFSNDPDQSEVPTECNLSKLLQTPHIQKWDPIMGRYLDTKGRFLQWDDLFKGWPFP